jgi:hypothetical protein
MSQYLLFATVALLSGLMPLVAQSVTIASTDAPAIPLANASAPDFTVVSSSLPDSPQPNIPITGIAVGTLDDQHDAARPATPNIPKYALIVMPGETITPLHGVREHLIYGAKDSFNPYQLLGITIAGGYSQVFDTEPHYGGGAEAFGKRVGAAALRSTIQNMGNDVVFSPMFHDDSRYYVLGEGHSFFKRAIYSATRVVITRASATGKDRLNVPLLLSFGIAAGVNNAYYPDQDRGAASTARNWATSLGGAALGNEASEFLNDALRLVHIKRD